ncbi:MAG: helicase [Bacteroidaceae bacterium]|nr:helicase [Bacteroidaceae bacterium]
MDFQKHTAERILQIYKSGHNRVLLADEVGLGKTFVAKSVIEKVRDWHKEKKDDFFQVVYICSNAHIADQNIRKLCNSKERINISENRLSMQHFNIVEQEMKAAADRAGGEMRESIIPLTPSTSFNFNTPKGTKEGVGDEIKQTRGSRLGTVGERALIYCILSGIDELKELCDQYTSIKVNRGALQKVLQDVQLSKMWNAPFTENGDDVNENILSNFLRCGVKPENWKWHIYSYIGKIEKLADFQFRDGSFLKKQLGADGYLGGIRSRIQKDGKSIIESLAELVSSFAQKMQAANSAELQPDADTAVAGTGQDITHQRSETINEIRRIFAEISIGLLNPDLVIMDEFQRFSSLLKEDDDSEQSMLVKKFFGSVKDNSRNSASDDGSASETVLQTKVLLLSATPYKPFTTLEELNTDGDKHYKDFKVVTDFLFGDERKKNDFQKEWENYSKELKNCSSENIKNLIDAKCYAENELYKVMCRTERFNTGIIKEFKDVVEVQREDVMSYLQLKYFMECLDGGDTKLRNLPVEYVKSAPYLLSFMDSYMLKKDIYAALGKAQAVFEKCGIAEQDNLLLLHKEEIDKYGNIPLANGKLNYLHNLVFGKDGRKKVAHKLLWMPATTPYYKANSVFESDYARDFSKVILFSAWEMVPRMVSVMMSYCAEKYASKEDPKYNSRPSGRLNEDCGGADGTKIKYKELLEYPCAVLAGIASKFIYNTDERLELNAVRAEVKNRIRKEFEQHPEISELLKQKRGKENAEYILRLMKMLDGKSGVEMPKYIPKNTLNVMTDIAIASPAVCAYRICNDEEEARKAASAIVRIFNNPEGTAVIDLVYPDKRAYYERVLDYCVAGNLQAVLDEYAHMNDNKDIARLLDEAVIQTITLNVDTVEDGALQKSSMRCHFAIPFLDSATKERSADAKTQNDGAKVLRITNIRNAFNSPFRPFILSTTSVGQEGLDFHWYSRQIMHWNLPSNPVDLEQREGRINRYKCLAIRKNVARLYGKSGYKSWNDMFDAAARELKGNHSDMVPYWCLPMDKIAAEDKKDWTYIERRVPLYPFSIDNQKYKRLVDMLALYRMTLGQPRQEDLLRLLSQLELDDETKRELTIDLCPFNKAKQQKP